MKRPSRAIHARGKYVGDCLGCGRALHYAGAGRLPLTCGRRACDNERQRRRRATGIGRGPAHNCPTCGHRHCDVAKVLALRDSERFLATHVGAAILPAARGGFKNLKGE